MGPSIWAGVAILVLAVPLNTFLAKKMRTLQKRQMGNKDARVKLMVCIAGGFIVKAYILTLFIRMKSLMVSKLSSYMPGRILSWRRYDALEIYFMKHH